jgi:hypothetical protein
MIPQDQYNQFGPQQGQGQPQYQQNPCPKTWLVESILATILCCLPFGIVGIVYAAKVESRYNAGMYAEAQEASNNAKMWTLISAGVGLLGIVSYICLIAFGVFASL